MPTPGDEVTSQKGSCLDQKVQIADALKQIFGYTWTSVHEICVRSLPLDKLRLLPTCKISTLSAGEPPSWEVDALVGIKEGTETMASRSPTVKLESDVGIPGPMSRHAQTEERSLVVSLGAPREQGHLFLTPNPSPPQIHLLSSFGESAPTLVQGRESPGRNIAAKACEILETKQLKPSKGHTVLDRPSFDPARGPNLGNRALRMALNGANLLGTPKSLKAASDVRPEDLRIKLLNLENKRLQADVNRSNAELYEARLDLSQCRCLLARAEEDLDGSRRCHEQVLTELRLELAHQRELVEAYQQVTTAQKRIASFTSQGSATKRPCSPCGEHTPHAKKPKQDNNDPFDHGISTNSNSGPIPHHISSMSSEGIRGPAVDSKAPKNSTEQQYVRATDKHTHVVAKDYPDLNLHVPDGYDRYLPSSRLLKESSARTTLFEGRSDLYRPRGSGWKSTVDRYVPEAERNEATGSPPSRTDENPDTSRSEPKATLSQKPLHVLLCGDISEVRKLSRGMNNFVLKNGPYAHAAQQPGIPRQCGRCFVTFASGTKLESHMCAKHGLLRGAETAPDACFRELHWKAV